MMASKTRGSLRTAPAVLGPFVTPPEAPAATRTYAGVYALRAFVIERILGPKPRLHDGLDACGSPDKGQYFKLFTSTLWWYAG